MPVPVPRATHGLLAEEREELASAGGDDGGVEHGEEPGPARGGLAEAGAAPDDADAPVDVPGGRTATMQPGQTGEPIKVTLAPGEYRLVCTIANHDDLGQYGELTVQE